MLKLSRSSVFFAIAIFLGVGLAQAVESDRSLTIVDAEFVCMVNDAAYDQEQVRVDVDGKTYYGCCDMCKARLAKDVRLRVAIDPVTGKQVDKAKAVIAKDSYKRVYYFESTENLEKANNRLSKQ